MAEDIKGEVITAKQVAEATGLRQATNGIRYGIFGDVSLAESELERIVQAVPSAVAAALERKRYYFVPLAMAAERPGQAEHSGGNDATTIASVYTAELAELSICHRNVALGADLGDGIFISSGLLNDRFSLAFEFFINAGHAFVDEAGVPEAFIELAWRQAVADVRGETSQDAWESRAAAISGRAEGRSGVDEKAKTDFLQAAFSDAVAIYMLSLAVDFDYSELREREYPLLAPQALADRLRLVAKLCPPNADYEFAIRYRRRP